MKNTLNMKAFLVVGLVLALGAFTYSAQAQVSNGDEGGVSSVSNGGDDSSSNGAVSNGDESNGSVSNGGDDNSASGSVSNGGDDSSAEGSVSNGDDDSNGSVTNGEDDSSATGSVTNGGDDNQFAPVIEGDDSDDNGNNRSNGRGGRSNPKKTPTPSPTDVAGNCIYLTKYSRFGANNDANEVLKLQTFLVNNEKANVDLNGIFDAKTLKAVENFQAKYLSEIMSPWGEQAPSGQVYITTTKKINELYCDNPFPLSARDIAIIEAYKRTVALAKLQAPQTSGSTVNGVPTKSPAASPSPSSIEEQEENNLNVGAAIAGVPEKIGNFFKKIFNFIFGK